MNEVGHMEVFIRTVEDSMGLNRRIGAPRGPILVRWTKAGSDTTHEVDLGKF